MAAQATERARAAAASRLEVLTSETARATLTLQTLTGQVDSLTRELDRTRGSLRTFLRHYLPRLRKYLFRR